MKNKKAFTLVEMLIVIVIIGILAAAILPSLLGARDKANDTARVSSLNQLNTAMVAYSQAAGEYVEGCGAANTILEADKTFMSNIENIPSDPNANNKFTDMNDVEVKGQFGYCAITKRTNENSAYVLMAKVSDPASANYIEGGTKIDTTTDYDTLTKKICKKVTLGEEVKKDDNGNCTIPEDKLGNLRYIVVKS